MFTRHEILRTKLTASSSPRSVAARAKPTIMVGRFCGRGMGVLREGTLPFPEVALWFISVDTEMNEKTYNRVLGVLAQHKTFCVSGTYFSLKPQAKEK